MRLETLCLPNMTHTVYSTPAEFFYPRFTKFLLYETKTSAKRGEKKYGNITLITVIGVQTYILTPPPYKSEIQ